MLKRSRALFEPGAQEPSALVGETREVLVLAHGQQPEFQTQARPVLELGEADIRVPEMRLTFRAARLASGNDQFL